MTKRTRPSLSTTVSLNTFHTIQETAIKLDCCHSTAIDRIVQEWAESTKKQPLYELKNQGDLSYLQQSLVDLDEAIALVSDLIKETTG